MGKLLVTNNATGRLASSINDTVTTLTLGSGEGDLFPNPLTDEFFFVTIIDASNNREIVKVTARSTNTFTVERGQDGTTATAFDADDRVELRPCAAVHAQYAQLTDNEFTGDQAITGDLSLTGTSKVIGAAAANRRVIFQTTTTPRWSIGSDDAAEAGSDAGSDFEVVSHNDAGSELAIPLKIARATGVATFTAMPTVSGAPIGVPSGTKMLFQQTSAPTGWTKITTTNNAALRLVSGTVGSGGTADFTTVFDARTILQANLPDVELSGETNTTGNHNHTVGNGNNSVGRDGGTFGTAGLNQATTSTDGNHSHTVTVALGGSGTAMDFAVKYVDVIVCSKN